MSADARDATPADLREAVERVLGEHSNWWSRPDGQVGCAGAADCKWTASRLADAPRVDHQHRAHVADALLGVLADSRAEAGLAEFARRSRTFWSLVDDSDEYGCWPWTGSRRGENDAYGGFCGTTAHRVSWALANGRVPEPREVVRHRCDNPICVSPAHLEIGEQVENVGDMIQRGRGHWQGVTECRNGHPRTATNLYISPSGKRECSDCRREQNERRRAARPSRGKEARDGRPTEREALAKRLAGYMALDWGDPDERIGAQSIASAILASDWLTDHDRRVAAAAWENGWADAVEAAPALSPGAAGVTNPYDEGDPDDRGQACDR